MSGNASLYEMPRLSGPARQEEKMRNEMRRYVVAACSHGSDSMNVW